MNKTSKIATYSKAIIHLALLLLAAVLLVWVNMQSHQAMPSFSLPLTFEGVYSQNGGEWKPLDENTRISALDGDLCSKVWVTWETPRLGPEDEIEIRLHNPYRF